MLRPVLSRAALVGAMAVVFAVLVSACSAECIDRFDCADRASAGEAWTCDDGTCVKGSPDPCVGNPALRSCDAGR